MNQEKIGKFIFELRKEKNMIQQELADKVGVTDRAISNWKMEEDYLITQYLLNFVKN